MIGPIFCEKIVKQDNYLDMLKDIVLSMTNQLYDDEEFYFQQNPTPSHYATKVHRLLNESLS